MGARETLQPVCHARVRLRCQPIVPKGIPKACIKISGDWTFIDMDGTRAGCPLKYGFLVAVLRRSCGPNGEK